MSVHRENLDKCGEWLKTAIKGVETRVEAYRKAHDTEYDFPEDLDLERITRLSAELAEADAKLTLAEIENRKI